MKINIDKYPAIKNYLLSFGKEKLIQEGRILSDGSKSRKKTGHKWFELQDTCAYYEEFDKTNIVWQRVTTRPTFCFSRPGQFVLDSTVFISGKQTVLDFILPILNSSTIAYWVDKNSHQLGSKGYLLSNQYVEITPIPKSGYCSSLQVSNILKCHENIKKNTSQDTLKEINDAINCHVYSIFDFTPEEIAVITKTNK